MDNQQFLRREIVEISNLHEVLLKTAVLEHKHLKDIIRNERIAHLAL